MINRVGLSGAVGNLQSNSNPSKTKVKITSFGRVKDIILDENHPRFNDFGQWNGLGTIIVEVFDKSNPGIEKVAKPYSPQSKSLPIINEVVQLFLLPIPTDALTLREEYYYLPSYNVWNSPHHNALPNPRNNNLPPSQQLDYQQTEGGLVRRVTDGSTEIDLNSPSNPSQNTFVEKSNVHPLLPFAGDVMYEGRWGNSLRFGSTAKSNSIYKNAWSNSGDNGDPIVILRNGQPPNTSDEGWIPITEDINQDLSSIYLTSTQKLSIDNNTISRFTPFSNLGRAITLNNYIGSQIFVNSDRIVLNAKKDSILIGSKKGINLSTEEYVNIKSLNLFIDSQNVKLGNENATEPILLGDKTTDLLSRIITQLVSICNILTTDQIYPGGTPVPNAPMNLAATNALSVLNELQAQLPTIKSKTSKTI
tara:strand:+ start:3670 stop:4929 length:1260 start_codon:yes stop_codon:yes gene_type:complete